MAKCCHICNYFFTNIRGCEINFKSRFFPDNPFVLFTFLYGKITSAPKLDEKPVVHVKIISAVTGSYYSDVASVIRRCILTECFIGTAYGRK